MSITIAKIYLFVLTKNNTLRVTLVRQTGSANDTEMGS
jgi:hypothetical protein